MLGEIDERSASITSGLAELNTTLETARGLSDSVTVTVRSIDDLATDMHERGADQEPTEIVEYQRLVDSAVDGVARIESSLAALERLLQPDTSDASPSRMDRSMTVAADSTRGVVDHVFLRGIQLTAIVLGGWVVAVVTARLITARLTGRPRGGER